VTADDSCFCDPYLLEPVSLQQVRSISEGVAPLRPMDEVQADSQPLIDIRRFRVSTTSEPVADTELSARILDRNGKVVASRLFQETQSLEKIEPPAVVVAAFKDALERIAQALVAWVVDTLWRFAAISRLRDVHRSMWRHSDHWSGLAIPHARYVIAKQLVLVL